MEHAVKRDERDGTYSWQLAAGSWQKMTEVGGRRSEVKGKTTEDSWQEPVVMGKSEVKGDR